MLQSVPAKQCCVPFPHQSNMSLYTRVTNGAKLEARGAQYAGIFSGYVWLNLLDKWRGQYETVSFLPCATTTNASTSSNDSIYPNLSVARGRSLSMSCLSWILSGELQTIALEHVLAWKVGFSIWSTVI